MELVYHTKEETTDILGLTHDQYALLRFGLTEIMLHGGPEPKREASKLFDLLRSKHESAVVNSAGIENQKN